STFSTSFTSHGWGTEGGADVASVVTADATQVDIPMLIYADANDAAGSLSVYGYPNAGGYDGHTMVEVTGTLTTNSHTDVPTSNGDMSVLVSDIGMQVYSGHSGSGTFLTNDIDGDGVQETYLAGIVSLDVQFVGGFNATGFEPLGDIYSALGETISAAGISANEFARATLVSGQQLASGFTTVEGTLLHEDLIGGQNSDTLSGNGGDDNLFGGDGADVLTGGEGKDVLTGGNGSDTFVMTAGGRNDSVLDFEKGTDVIDVSSWGVTGLSDLSITDHHSGRVIVRKDKDALVLDDGARGLTAASFVVSDFVFASGSEPLEVIEGTSGNDKLVGTSLDEELRDGLGIDSLFGRGGADTFVLAADAEVDSVKDFEDGIDTLDISAWGAIALGELTLTDQSNGKILLEYEDEILVLSDAARALRVVDLSAEDFVFA
ncbi:MAG: calcium-binding protein, partial [Paracoccaceae bacterium]